LTIVILSFSYAVCGQTATEEIIQLREHLGLTEQAKILPSTSPSLGTIRGPLNVFIATGLDMKVHDNFIRWIEKWNKSGDANKYGSLNLVSDIDHAEIVLARYTLNIQARSQTASYPSVGTVYDPATNSIISRPTQRTYSYSTVPVFAYVLRREGVNYEILSRYSDSASLGEFKSSGELLWKDFINLLKRRQGAAHVKVWAPFGPDVPSVAQIYDRPPVDRACTDPPHVSEIFWLAKWTELHKSDKQADDVCSYILYRVGFAVDGIIMPNVGKGNDRNRSRSKTGALPRRILGAEIRHSIFRLFVKTLEGQTIRNNDPYTVFRPLELYEHCVFRDILVSE
jgi:hypothetical protein